MEVNFKSPGRPRVYNLDLLEVNQIEHITCKKGDRDNKLKSARASCYAHSKNGKKFRATATETGIAIKREA